VALWFMSGATIQSGSSLGTVSTAWTPDRIGDFDGDGKADILWRNTSSGDVAIWLMNGPSIASNTFITSVPTSWETQ